jgi:Protein of unknown function (DUF2892)
MAAMDTERNVGEMERLVSTLGGAALILNAVIRPSAFHTVLALGGVALVRRGLTGSCAVYRMLGVDSSERAVPHKTYGTGKRGERSIADEIDTAAEHSFPASDPPSWVPHSSVGSPEVVR